MTPLECAQLFHDWTFWARPEQAPPPGDWIVWLILAGRGAGKTRAGAEAVRRWAQDFPIVNLIGPTADDVRDVMVLGEFGHSQLLPQDEQPRYLASAGAARMAERRGELAVLRRGARPAARQAAHEALVRRARRLAAARGVRSGAARPAPRRQAAGGRHHDAAADQDHQAARRATTTRSSPAARPSTTRATSPRRFSSASPRATRAARSGGRSCSPRSSRRRRGPCGRAR